MSTAPKTMTGPLIASSRNPRYFTGESGERAGKAVYLTGSHIWNNLHDGMGPGAEGSVEPERFDYDRSEEHTSELQSHVNLVCRLLLEIGRASCRERV